MNDARLLVWPVMVKTVLVLDPHGTTLEDLRYQRPVRREWIQGLAGRAHIRAFQDKCADFWVTSYEFLSGSNDIVFRCLDIECVVSPVIDLVNSVPPSVPIIGVSRGAPTARKCAGVRLPDDMVITPTRLPGVRFVAPRVPASKTKSPQARGRRREFALK